MTGRKSFCYLRGGAFNVHIRAEQVDDIVVVLRARRYRAEVHNKHRYIGNLVYLLWALKVKLPC